MKYAKCIDISNDLIYTIKYNTCEVDKLPLLKLHQAISNGELTVINIKYDGVQYNFEWNREELYNYRLLAVDEISEKSKQALNKSILLGVSTYNGINNVAQVKRVNDDVLITDSANIINSSILCKTITFIGQKVIESNKSKSTVKRIRTNKVIIKNRCVISNILRINVSSDTDTRVTIIPHNICISHEFVDINTIHEVLVLLDEVILNCNEDVADLTVNVNFQKAGVDAQDVVNRTISITQTKINEHIQKIHKKQVGIKEYESLYGYMSLACSMYISTGYEYDELLELATICESYIIENEECAKRKETKLLHDLITRLYGGARF